MTAAAVCYLGPLMPAARDELFADWLRVCDGVSREPQGRLLTLSSMLLEDSRKKSKYDENDTGNRPNTRNSVSSHFQTPRKKWKIQLAAGSFGRVPSIFSI